MMLMENREARFVSEDGTRKSWFSALATSCETGNPMLNSNYTGQVGLPCPRRCRTRSYWLVQGIFDFGSQHLQRERLSEKVGAQLFHAFSQQCAWRMARHKTGFSVQAALLMPGGLVWCRSWPASPRR